MIFSESRFPLFGIMPQPDARFAPLKSLVQCTIFASGHHVRWLIVTRDRSKILDGVIRNNPRSRVLRQPDPGRGLGRLRKSGSRTGKPERAGHVGLPGAASCSCANSTISYNPFVSHAFFSSLEASGSAAPRTGWGPRHLLARLDGTIAGIVPCYLKSHSQGEYVFDRGWADAYERAGGRYYPKLQVSVPFTPATGPRLLIRNGVDRERIGTALASGLVALCGVTKASSVHVTFARETEAKYLAGHGFLQRTDQQFHWHNQGYGSFDDFLGSLNSRHRKAIKRERRDAVVARSRFTRSPAATSPKTPGTPSSSSTWRPARGNGAGPT